jgi:hypothetical protein
MDGVTQDQMRARLFRPHYWGRLCNGSTLNRRRRCKIGTRWWRLSWRNTTRRVKHKACIIRLPPLFNIIRKLSRRHSSASTSTLGRFHITSSEGRPRAKVLSRTHHGVKDDHRCIGGRIHHRTYADGSFHSIQEGRG